MTQSKLHVAAETKLPNFSENPERAKSESAMPVQPNTSKAMSFGNQKKMLGDCQKPTSFTNRGTGSSPRSPKSGLNWLTPITFAWAAASGNTRASHA